LDDSSAIQPDTGNTYGQMMTLDGLKTLKEWATGIGPWKYSCINYNSPDYESLGLIENAHSVGLLVNFICN
jgi:glycerophosphoryl diester phosphodiesterase